MACCFLGSDTPPAVPIRWSVGRVISLLRQEIAGVAGRRNLRRAHIAYYD
jgi:hypothetical protein